MRLSASVTLVALLALFGIGLAGGWLLFGGDGDSDSGDTSLGDLFAQTAQGGTFAKHGERLVLTLHDASRTTTVFSDRPERRTDSLETQDFVAGYRDLFANDPPNATLSSLERGRGEFTVELRRPRYDSGTDALSYEATPIGTQATEFPDRFGSASLFIDAGADTVANAGYACTRSGSDDPWICTFNDSDYQVQVSDLVNQLSGVSTDSAFCLQAWGGAGGNGATAAGGSTGRGGDGGYARTSTHFGADTTIGYLIGASGSHGGGTSSGSGGSSTIVGTGPIENTSGGADDNQQFANQALLVAGGGGGGSYGDGVQTGHDGGDGGSAVATTGDGTTGAGGGGHGNNGGDGGNAGHGGAGGKGGSGSQVGGDGFGGTGGQNSDGYSTPWHALQSGAQPPDGAGGDVQNPRLYHGGAGGGGYGGGGAGQNEKTSPAGGGGGGGSFAKVASVSDSGAPPECTDPPTQSAAFRIVIFTP